MRYSRQREAVINALRATTEHPTADMLYTTLRAELPDISLATVYRNLSGLVAAGEAISFSVNGCEHFDARTQNHYHMVCKSCSRVVDMDIPYRAELDREAAERSGMTVENHFLMFCGVCNNCRKNSK